MKHLPKGAKAALIALGGAAAVCLLAVSALFCLSGGFMKPAYLEPWSKSYAAGFADPRVRVAARGLLAASNHNMQPWKIKLDGSDPQTFYLYADSSRMTKEVDPDARQMMISQGTFLEYVAVAAQEDGFNASIRLFPAGVYDETHLARSMDEKPVAQITLSKAAKAGSVLYGALFLPDTNRDAYRAQKLSAGQVSALESLPAPQGVSVRIVQDSAGVQKIGSYALKSAAVEAGVARVMDESNAIFRPNEYAKNRYRYGYSVEGQGISGFRKDMLQGLLTLFPSLNAGKAASQNFIQYTRASVESAPAYALLVSSGNGRVQQVESGMLYSRLVLTGHTLGLAMQPLSQVLEEYPEMRTLYSAFRKEYAPGGGTVQMLFRVGVPTQSVPVSMRRDVGSLLVR